MQRHRGWVTLALVAAGVTVGCVQPLELFGRRCPCAEGFACCAATGLCVRPQELTACTPPPDAAAGPADTPVAPTAYPPPLDPQAPIPLPPADAAPGPLPDAAADAPAAMDASAAMDAPVAMGCPGEPRGVRYYHWEDLDHFGQMATGQSPTFAFSWPDGRPDPSLPVVSGWSSVFATQLQPKVSGDYTFFVNTDDGFTLVIDSEHVLDWLNPYNTGGHVIAARVPLQAGRRYAIMMDYRNRTGGGALELTWQPPGGAREPIPACELYLGPVRPSNCADPFSGCWVEGNPFCTTLDRGNGLDISFFANRDFTKLVHKEDIALVNLEFKWDWLYQSSTDPALRNRKFAIRWEGDLRAPLSETYTFFLLSDAETTVRIGDRMLHVNADPEGIMRETTFEMPLAQRAPYRVQVDYLQQGTPESSKLQLHWRSRSQSKAPISYCYLYGSAPPVVWDP